MKSKLYRFMLILKALNLILPVEMRFTDTLIVSE